MTLGQLIDQLDTIRERKRKLAEQIKVLEGEYSELEDQVKARLTEEGMDKATGKKATASLSQVVVATVKDWDALCAYVKKTGHFHLFQRRVSDPAFRELVAKKPVPGLEPFTKTNLNLTHLKTGE
jgi:hypothetical protein